MRTRFSIVALAAVLPLATAGCDLPPLDPPPPDPFAPETERVVVEVDVQDGAEPFTGATVYGDTWDLTVENLAALLGEDIELVVPRTLDEMGPLDDVPAGDLSSSEIVALAGAHVDATREDDLASGSARYHVLFVDRFYEEDGARRDNVLGVSIGNTRVVAMFKPVIGDGGALLLDDGVDRFVEQTTMVHELGHALGLVNNGLTMKREHQDEENGAHCSNDACVMFFLNEGFEDAVGFARDALLRGDRVLFDDDCLDDADAS
jgi:hypothetical protein